MGFLPPIFAVAVVVLVFLLTQVFKRFWAKSPIYLGWIFAVGLTAAAWVLFPGEVSLDSACWVVVGVFGLQGGVKNVQTIMASFQAFRGRGRVDYGMQYPDVKAGNEELDK